MISILCFLPTKLKAENFDSDDTQHNDTQYKDAQDNDAQLVGDLM